MKSVFRVMLLTAVMIAPLPLLATTKAVMPKCAGRVVWIVPEYKSYVLSNNPHYGKKPGRFACESTGIAHGYHMRPLQIMHMTTHTKTGGSSSPKPNPSPSPAALSAVPENPAMTTLARAQIDIIRTGKIDRAQYGANLNAALTDAVVTQWSQLLAVSGPVTSFSYNGSTQVSGLPVAQYAVTFEHPISVPGQPTTNQWVESIAADQNGKVVYLLFQPKH